MTVKQVSELTGISVRALQYYDKIGLLKPSRYTDAGYRLYDDKAMDTLQQILLFKELEFPLKEIKKIICSKSFDRDKALEQQIELLTMKKEHLERLIDFAREIKQRGEYKMDFSVFDKGKIEEYSNRAKEQWGNTEQYRESVEKCSNRSEEENMNIASEFMSIFREFGSMKDLDVSDIEVQAQVKKLQDYISDNYYKCSDEILLGLGQMYACGGEFTDNIDKAGGYGTAVFVGNAINVYCKK